MLVLIFTLLCYCFFPLDPPRLDSKDVEAFAVSTVVKTNQKAQFKIPYIGHEPVKIQWYKEGEELTPDTNCKIEISEGHTSLLLTKLQRKDSGEIKVKIKNEFGTVEVISNLVVLGKHNKAYIEYNSRESLDTFFMPH